MGKVRRDARGEETVWYFDREREGGSKSQTVGFMHLWVAQCLATSVAVQMNRRNNTYGPENSSCISSLCITLSVFEIRHLSWAAHGITGKPKGVLARGQFLWARAQAFIPYIYICISTHTRDAVFLHDFCRLGCHRNDITKMVQTEQNFEALVPPLRQTRGMYHDLCRDPDNVT